MNEGDLERVYQDVDLVCCDGVSISYPKLVAGLVFPSLATCHVLQFPTQHTLLLPDYTSADVTSIVHAVLGLRLDALFSNNCDQKAVKDEDDTKDLSEYLEVETKEDSDDEEMSGDDPLICKICFAQFKTRSGWKNHKVIHQKFRTKEFACYICFRRFYWEKDCRRHVKNIHGVEDYHSEESRAAANINQSSYFDPEKRGNDFFNPNDDLETNPIDLSTDLKNNFLKMKIQMVKCKKNQLNNAINNKKVVMKPNCDNSQVKEISGHSQIDSKKSNRSNNRTLNNNVKTNFSSSSEETGEKPSLMNGLEASVDSQNVGQNSEKNKQEYSTKSKDTQKKFPCQECSKKFLNLKSLKSHSRGCNAPKDSPYSCTLCDRRFIDFEKLQRHWKVNHSRQTML